MSTSELRHLGFRPVLSVHNADMTYSSMSRQSQVDVPHEGVDVLRLKIPTPSCPRPEKPESPLERFCSEHQRHEKIALMMRGGREEAKTHHGLARKQIHGCNQQEYIPTKGIASEPHSDSKPPSPPFRPHLQVDGSDGLETGEGDPHLEAIRIAARIK